MVSISVAEVYDFFKHQRESSGSPLRKQKSRGKVTSPESLRTRSSKSLGLFTSRSASFPPLHPLLLFQKHKQIFYIWSLPPERIYCRDWQTLWFLPEQAILFVKRLTNYPWHFKCLHCPWAKSVKIRRLRGVYTSWQEAHFDRKSEMNLSCSITITFQAGKEFKKKKKKPVLIVILLLLYHRSYHRAVSIAMKM